MQQPNLHIISSISDIRRMEEMIRDAEFVAVDTETTGVDRGSQIVGISVCASEDEAWYVIVTPENWAACHELMMHLKLFKLIMHNGTFDCGMIEDNFKIRLISHLYADTMILAHLLDENRLIGLKPLGASYFGWAVVAEQDDLKESVLANGGEWTAKNKEMWKADSQILGKYGAKDAWLTLQVYYKLIPELEKQPRLKKFFYEDESMPMLRGPTYQLNRTGLSVNTTRLTELKKTLEAECAEDLAFINNEIQKRVLERWPKGEFKLSSPTQMAELCFGIYGMEFGYLTKGGKIICKNLMGRLPYTKAQKNAFIAECNSRVGEIIQPEAIMNGKKKRAKKLAKAWKYIASDKNVLAKHSEKYKWIARYLSYQKKMKLLSTYVNGIEERMQYGIIRPSFLQHGTTSGRYSSRNPNFQNLPRDDKRVKGCILSRPGKSFVGADYSQLEPRVFAYYSRDERLLAAFDGESDFYSVIGRQTFGKFDCTVSKFDDDKQSFKNMFKGLRQDTKGFCLAATYGGTAWKLSSILRKPVEETQTIIDDYFEEFPGVRDNVMLEAHNLVKKFGFVTNIFGRKRRLPEAKRFQKIYGNTPHEDLPYEVRNVLNLAVNHRIQCTGASIINRAAVYLLKLIEEAGIEECYIILQVHDELILECRDEDAKDVATLLQFAMETAVDLKTVRLEAVPKIGKTLADLK